MPGRIQNSRVTLPKWHKPRGKLEARKPNNFKSLFEEMVGLVFLSFSWIIARFHGLLVGQRRIWKAEPTGSAPGILFPDLMLLGKHMLAAGKDDKDANVRLPYIA